LNEEFFGAPRGRMCQVAFLIVVLIFQNSCKERRSRSGAVRSESTFIEVHDSRSEDTATSVSFIERWKDAGDFAARCKLVRVEAEGSDGGSVATCLSRLVTTGVLSRDDAELVAAYFFTTEVLPMEERWAIFNEAIDGEARMSLVRYLFAPSLKSAVGVEEALNYFGKLPPGELTRKVARDMSSAVLEHLGVDRFLEWSEGLDRDEMHEVAGSVSRSKSIDPDSLIELASRPNIGQDKNLILESAARRFIEEGRSDDAFRWGIENQCVSQRFWSMILKNSDIGKGASVYQEISSIGNRVLSATAAVDIASRLVREGDTEEAEKFAAQLSASDGKFAYLGIAEGMVHADMDLNEILNYGRQIGDSESRKAFLRRVAFVKVGFGNLEEYRRILEVSGDKEWVDSVMQSLERRSGGGRGR